jgi:hypothetical protein
MYFQLREIAKLLRAVVLKKQYFTYKLIQKPISHNQVEAFSHLPDKRRIAFVLQGPFIADNHFTFDTCRMYKCRYPEVEIILSTTTNIRLDEQEKLRQLGVHLVLCSEPNYSGIANINFQIRSTNEGIKRARELGAEYVLKTRTDQRLLKPALVSTLLSYIDSFPMSELKAGQRHRLIACSRNTFKLRMYGVSDMFLFGHIEDMRNYWGREFDNRVFADCHIDADNCTWREHAEAEFAEVGFCTSFLRKMGEKLEFTLQDSYKHIIERFLIIDHEALDLFWPKYSLNQDLYEFFGKYSELTFSDWLYLKTKINDVHFHDDLLDIMIGREGK